MTDDNRRDGAPADPYQQGAPGPVYPEQRPMPAAPPPGRRGPPRSARARVEPGRLKEPMRASRRARHPLVIAGNAFFTLILLGAISFGVVYAVGKQRFERPGPLTEDRVVNIPRGGVQDMADVLVREGVIDDKWTFIGGIIALRARDDMRAGEYMFRSKASPRDVVRTIAEGKAVEHRITIPEGLTSEQVVARLMEIPILTGSVREIPREGSLLPETYNVIRGTSREQVIQRMQQAQRRVVEEAWEKRASDLPLTTPEQLVVLASIVERETGQADERTRVAGVFVNRLRQRMRLQSDPTIIYGLVGGKGTLGRPILRSEIEQPTPYNTYVINGLPPGPIANPGRASIEASANPDRHRDLYFVADGTGGHAFAETLEQHNRNVARWRQIEREQREAAARGSGAGAPAEAETPASPVQAGAPARAPRRPPPRP